MRCTTRRDLFGSNSTVYLVAIESSATGAADGHPVTFDLDGFSHVRMRAADLTAMTEPQTSDGDHAGLARNPNEHGGATSAHEAVLDDRSGARSSIGYGRPHKLTGVDKIYNGLVRGLVARHSRRSRRWDPRAPTVSVSTSLPLTAGPLNKSTRPSASGR